MSRLEFFVGRLTSQLACLNRAAELIDGLDGIILELGLGNGRSYDHLRELFPMRDIYVCERQVGAHPDCIPPADRLLLGDLRETLREVRPWMAGQVALVHVDIGTGDAAVDEARAAETLPLVMPLLRAGGVVASDLNLDCAALGTLPLPKTVTPGRYHLYQLPDRQLPDRQLPDRQLPDRQLPDRQLPDRQPAEMPQDALWPPVGASGPADPAIHG